MKDHDTLADKAFAAAIGLAVAAGFFFGLSCGVCG